MGCLCSKKVDPVRRDKLESANDIIKSEEGLERLRSSVAEALPGTSLRWDKVLKLVNTNEEATFRVKKGKIRYEDGRIVDGDDTKVNNDPLRVNLTIDELKKTFRTLYNETKIIKSDGLLVLREYLPQIYDKHSYERGRRVSQKEREEKIIIDECFAYGEIDFEIFSTIFAKIRQVYGFQDNGVFYDLGCGVGNLVFCAAYLGNFSKVVGIEFLQSLHERGLKRIPRYEGFKENYPLSIRKTRVEFIQDDFLLCDYWSESTFLLLHWTALNKEQQMNVSNKLRYCREGTFVLAFTHPIPDVNWEILIQDKCETSWGEAVFYIQEKLNPAAKKN
jgi:SAM-dependent methyltransferase